MGARTVWRVRILVRTLFPDRVLQCFFEYGFYADCACILGINEGYSVMFYLRCFLSRGIPTSTLNHPSIIDFIDIIIDIMTLPNFVLSRDIALTLNY